MKTYKKLFLLTAMMLLPAVSVFSQNNDVRIWVSPQGNDQADGSEQQPFATLEKAFAQARQLRSDAGSTEIGTIHIVL